MNQENFEEYRSRCIGEIPSQIDDLKHTLDWPIKDKFYILNFHGDYVSMIQSEHQGIDLLVPAETEVFSPLSGSLYYEDEEANAVFKSELCDAIVKYVGLKCSLRHLDLNYKTDRTSIEQGQPVGVVGRYPMDIIYNDGLMRKVIENGGSFDHLHLEFEYRDININPLLLLKYL